MSDRYWALSEKGKQLVDEILASGVENKEFAIRVAETMVSSEELYQDISKDG